MDGQRDRSLKVFEEEKQIKLKHEKEIEDALKKTKKVVYPTYALAFLIISIVMYAQHQQAKIIEVDEKKLTAREQVDNYQYSWANITNHLIQIIVNLINR